MLVWDAFSFHDLLKQFIPLWVRKRGLSFNSIHHKVCPGLLTYMSTAQLPHHTHLLYFYLFIFLSLFIKNMMSSPQWNNCSFITLSVLEAQERNAHSFSTFFKRFYNFSWSFSQNSFSLMCRLKQTTSWSFAVFCFLCSVYFCLPISPACDTELWIIL